ncbi:zinc-binding dehydrogenase [Streptomyces sp. KR55]|uniref:zinc-binding dehydrogenase n=1 Tax=Streptomyces sp. KR55 TaxID=3457425 RepID=UPI003FD5831B
MGARVTATTSARDTEFVAGLGAHNAIDYAGSRFEDHVADVDVAFDTVGGDTRTRSWAPSAPRRRPGQHRRAAGLGAAQDHAARGVFFAVEPDRDGLDSISELITNRRLSPKTDRVVPLAQTRAVYEALEKEHQRGKVVIHVTDGQSTAAQGGRARCPHGPGTRIPRPTPRGRDRERGPARIHPGAVDRHRGDVVRSGCPRGGRSPGAPRRCDAHLRRVGCSRIRRCPHDAGQVRPGRHVDMGRLPSAHGGFRRAGQPVTRTVLCRAPPVGARRDDHDRRVPAGCQRPVPLLCRSPSHQEATDTHP